ncbi:epidermal growth factor receptor substrate 15-like protein 1 [Tanacetum coccineum]
MQTQNFGIRSQGPPPSVAPPSAQYFAPQGNQSTRQPPQSSPLPSQGVGGPSFPASGGLASPGLSNSNVSGDWLGGRGTGIASAPMFGGDVFSASSSSSMPTQTASIPPVSSAIVPVTSEPQTPAKIDPLGALTAFTRQPTKILKQVWDLSDQDNDSMLSLREFCIALYLMERYREGQNLPPHFLVMSSLLSLTGPPNPSCRPAGW